MKIRSKLTLMFLAASLIPIAAAGSILYTSETSSLIEKEYDILDAELYLKADEISMFLNDAKKDVLFLSEMSSLRSLMDADSPEEEEAAMLELQNDMRSFSANERIYYQIRYINEKGDEIVRIDSDGNGYHVIPEDGLQNKKDRYYFRESVMKVKGEVFVSRVDLNVENGIVENRGTRKNPEYVPVIRYATPVYDSLNQSKGIVITNVYAENFLRVLESKIKGESAFLLDEDGFYLFHENESMEWGFMFGNDMTFAVEYPEESLFIKQEEASTQTDSMMFNENDAHIMVHKFIPLGDEEYLALVILAQKEIILEPVRDAQNKIMIISLLVAVAAIMASYHISRSFTEPILQLSKAAKSIGQGHMDTRIKAGPRDEIGDLATSFKKMSHDLKVSREKLEYSNKLKVMFIDIIRHDILNPVTVIKGYAELLSKKLRSSPAVRSILEQVKVTEYIIDSANEYAKVEDLNSLEKESLSLKGIIEDVCSQVEPRFDKAGLELKNNIRERMPLKANTLIKEVFLNLLTNALKYAPEGKVVEINGISKDKEYEINVVDYGKGVADKYKESIFTRLTRKEKKGVKGTGLGLAIVKKLVELHDGNAFVKDNPKGGAIFVVILPRTGT